MMSPFLMRLLVPGLIGLGLAGGGFYVGWKVRDADYQAHLVKDKEQAAEVQVARRKAETKNLAKVQKLQQDLEDEKAKERIVYRDVIKRIPEYVTRTEYEERIIERGGLGLGFVYLHNSSASGRDLTIPSSASPLNPDTPSGVDLSTLAGAIAGNYAMCREWRLEASTWRAWYEELKADWPGDNSSNDDLKEEEVPPTP